MCRAAVHHGLISNSGGGLVRFVTFGSRGSHLACSKNGVSTQSYGSWPSYSLYLACDAGYYPNGASCQPCGSDNKYSIAGATVCTAVTVGYYSTGGTSTTRSGEQHCQRGHYCIAGVRYSCAAGRYGSSTMLTSADCTGLCPAGFYCLEASRNSNDFECGGAHVYCPEGSSEPLEVPLGSYSTPESAAVTRRSGVQVCEAGYYCSGGVRAPCVAGTYGSTTGLSSGSCSGPCEVGHYCPEGSVSATANKCGGADKYCPEGSGSPLTVQSGHYSTPLTAAVDVRSASAECDPGHWCANGVRNVCASGFFEPNPGATSECTSQCPAGSYCPPGANTPLPCGSAANYCPARSTTASTADPGFYTTPTSAPEAEREGVAQCEAGYFCILGSRTPCPGGTYGSTAQLSSSSCTGRCPAGYFCPPGTVTSTSNPCGSVDRFCPSGSVSATTATPGFYTIPEVDDATTRTGEVECPIGSYCAGGVNTPCPAGRYGARPGQATLEAGCVLCTPGFVCPDEGMRERDLVPCGGVDVVCPSGATAPTVVQPGSFSAPLGVAEDRRDSQSPCPVGMWCLGGERNPCPAGRYGATQSLATANCTGTCAPGYYCPPTSVSATQEFCELGHYCPGDGRAIVPCPAGTFFAGVNGAVVGDCQLCPAGTFQPDTGVGSDAGCLPCGAPEYSAAGASVCWPALVAVTASSKSIPTAGIRDNDLLQLTFSKDTNEPSLTTANIQQFLDLSANLATTLIPTWQSPAVLQVQLSGVDTTVPPPAGVDVEQTAIGTLMVGVQPGWIRDATEQSATLVQSPLLVNGTWGVATRPEIAYVAANNTGGGEGLDAGDTLHVVFDQIVKQVPVSNAASLQNLLSFSSPLFSEAAARWTVDYVTSRSSLDVTVLAVHPDFRRDGAWFDTLQVTVRPEGAVLSLDGASPPANGTAALTVGSWGEPPCRIHARVHSSTSLYVTVTPPSRFPNTQLFEVHWSRHAAFPAASTTVVPSSSPVVLLDGLDPAVPVYLRAAAGNDAADTTLGPFLQFVAQGLVHLPSYDAGASAGGPVDSCTLCTRCSCAAHPSDIRGAVPGAVPAACLTVTPLPPVVTQVALTSGGDRLATAGGQSIQVRGYHLGVPGWEDPSGDPYVRVTYGDGPSPGAGRFSFEAADCVIDADALDDPAADDAAVPPQTLQCTSSAGVGSGLRVVAVVGGGMSDPSSERIGYEAPVVSSFSSNGTLAATRGGDAVLIHGNQFGRQADGAIDAVLYRPSGYGDSIVYHAADCQLLEDHVLVQCDTVPGAGARMDWQITVAGQNSSTPFTAYRAPVITAVESAAADFDGVAIADAARAALQALDTAGGQYVDVVGTDFGAGMDVVTSVEYSNPAGLVVSVPVDACRMVVPHARLRCLTQPAVGRDFQVAFSVLDQASSVAAAAGQGPNGVARLSYTPPVVHSWDPVAISSAGGTLVLHGAGFGPASTVGSLSAFVNGGRVPAVSIVEPHTGVSFVVPHKPFANVLTVQVTVAGQQLDTPMTVEVFRPQVTAASANELRTPPDDLPVNGTDGVGVAPYLLTLQGDSFGASLDNVSVTIVSSLDGSVHACALEAFTAPHVGVECWTSFRSDGQLVLRARGVASDPYTILREELFAPPDVTGVVVAGGGAGGTLPTTGGTIVISGADMYTPSSEGALPIVTLLKPASGTGAADSAEEVLAAAVWTAPCPVVVDDTLTAESLRCVAAPGAGSGLRVALADRGRLGMSPPDALAYSSPVVATLDPATGPTVGGTTVAVYGFNFGPSSAPGIAVTVFVGGVAAVVTSRNHTLLTVVTPAGTSPDSGVPVTVHVAGATSAPALPGFDMFVYDAPALAPTFSITSTSPTQGGGVVAISGSNLGPPGALTVRFSNPVSGDLFDCSVTANTHSSASCVMGPGAGTELELVLHNGGRQTTFPFAQFGYLPPSLSAVFDVDSTGASIPADPSAQRRPASGGFLVAVEGSSFSASGTVSGPLPLSVCVILSLSARQACSSHVYVFFSFVARCPLGRRLAPRWRGCKTTSASCVLPQPASWLNRSSVSLRRTAAAALTCRLRTTRPTSTPWKTRRVSRWCLPTPKPA